MCSERAIVSILWCARLCHFHLPLSPMYDNHVCICYGGSHMLEFIYIYKCIMVFLLLFGETIEPQIQMFNRIFRTTSIKRYCHFWANNNDSYNISDTNKIAENNNGTHVKWHTPTRIVDARLILSFVFYINVMLLSIFGNSFFILLQQVPTLIAPNITTKNMKKKILSHIT